MGSNCCKGDAAGPARGSSIYTRYLWLALVVAQEWRQVPWVLRPRCPSRAGASLDDRFTTSDDAGGVRLTVSTARTGDSGIYTLQASNVSGTDTARVRLEVSQDEAPTGDDPPTFLRRLQDLTVKVGTRTRFLVEIVSSTECKVTWYRNERRLMEAERVSLVRDGHFWCADVAAVSVDDAGRWTCTAENAGGRASCSAHLNVLVPKAYKRPEFVEELRALLTEQGTVSLECKVVGVPTPVLRWFKDSREIKAGDVFALTANAEDPTSLGTYTCEAVNCMGRAYSSSKVHVVGRSREGSAKPIAGSVTPEPPPIFTKELEEKFLRICEPLSLGCHVVVPPWPRSVVWYNKEGKVEAGDRYHVTEDGVGGYLLEVPSAEWPDEGEWKCVATSQGGRVGISTCYVTMDVPKNYRKPRFMENLQAVLTEEGLVSFECKVVGFPTPVLSWFKDGQELKPGDVYQLTGTNSLGSYCCIARNCMGQASSSAELTVEDIQNQLNEEEKLQLFSKNQAPKFLQGLKSVEAKIDEPFRFTIKVAIPPEPSVLWYRDDQPVDDSSRCHHGREEKGLFHLDVQNLEFLDQAEWKCVAMNDFGHSVTSCFLKLIIPRHYKKPRFLENLQAILSDEGAVNLECKVIGVPQPILKWYKDGEELKPGDIHRIISGQDGTCCLGTYTCEAQNCMGIAASSASLLGFDDSMKAKKKKAEEQALQRNLSLSTIHEERTSQMYDTPVGDITLDDKGEISFSFDGKEVSVSLYETPDLTEEEALQIVEMYADQLSENVTEHNVVELPPLRFVKETSTSGNLLMEAIIIDVSPEYFASPEEDLRTEADVEDISIADENGPPQLSLDTDLGEDYLEKTMALLSEEKAEIPKKAIRKKSDSVKSGEDFFSLSREQSLSEEKRDDDTQVFSESDIPSFASARSSGKPKSKSSKPSDEDGKESSDVTKTILFKDEAQKHPAEAEQVPVVKPKRERRSSRSSRRSSSGSEKSFSKSKEELKKTEADPSEKLIADEEFKSKMTNVSSVLTKIINDVQIIERDIILKSELMSSAATASRSLEIISSLITPLSEIHSIVDVAKESVSESKEVSSTLFSSLPQPLKSLQQSLTIIEKCIDVESDNKTLVKKTCVGFIEACGVDMQQLMSEIGYVSSREYLLIEDKTISEIELLAGEMTTVIKYSVDTIKTRNLLNEASEIRADEPSIETKHLRDTQKAVFELRGPLNSLLCIAESADSGKIIDVTKVKNSEVILTDMSASIQDLQAALEQIESLSVKESNTSLHKYNTEIIETVMESILKLRGSFEHLSTETKNEEDRAVLKQALTSIKLNLGEISSQIDTIERNVGPFDILQSDNKLEVLQKMAQILIALENNLPRLETMPEVKTHMDVFHKNLTKVLENVIESNEAKKYFTLMEVCDTVNRVNASIKNMTSDSILSLASLSNTLRIIQDNFVRNVFEPELNCSILSNITDVLIDIEEVINNADEISVQIDSEHIQELSIHMTEETKAKVIVEHIEQTIAAISNVKSLESTQNLSMAIIPALENICPILEELKRSVASARPCNVEKEEHVSEMSDISFTQTIAAPVCELQQNLVILNQTLVENIDSLKENTEIMAAIAEPLHELHVTLEVLQQDVISQYGEDVKSYDASVHMANAVQSLQSCIVIIQEQAGVEAVEDMSTLEDISGIKTTADTIPSDRLTLPAAEETAIEQSLEPLSPEFATTASANVLQTLNEHIIVLQTPEIIDALDTLSEVSDYSSLKSIALGLGELHSGIEEILHPFIMESSNEISFANTSKLSVIAEPMQELQQSLSVLDINNIPIYEHILEMPAERIHSVLQSICDFKEHLNKCIRAIFPAMETADKTIEISNKVETLREVCEHLKDIIENTKSFSLAPVKQEVIALEETVNNLLDATDVSKGIKIDQVKSITEELYQNIITVQEEIIQFTPQTPEKLKEEAKLIQTIDEIESNIAVLEQYEFVDLSRASDITSCTSPQLAMELESESLMQMEDIVENAVNVCQDSAQETPVADLMLIEDFFKTCKNEFTILRCLMSKQLSHKKIIRLLQEFSSLQSTIDNFRGKRSELKLSEDIDGYLSTFLIHADDCLKNVQASLIKVVNSQSEVLFKTPLNKLDNTAEILKEIAVSKKSSQIQEVIKKFADAIEIAIPCGQNAEVAVIEELKYPSIFPKTDEHILSDKIEEITVFIEDQTNTQSLDDESKQILQKVLQCIQKHNDYKDAVGTGKTLIILKCLSECSDVLQEQMLETQTKASLAEHKIEDTALKSVLTEMLEPLHALHCQLINVQEQILSGVEEDSVSMDITSTESLVQTMAEIHKGIVQQIESETATIENEDISLIMEVDKEIHSIQDSLRAMENVQVAQAVKEISKPIEDIEKSLNTILCSEKLSVEAKGKLPAEKRKELILHIDQYIELIEIVEEISAVIKIDNLQDTVNIAKELRESVAASETQAEEEVAADSVDWQEITTHQTLLAQKLQTAISALHIQVLDSAQELAPAFGVDVLQRIARVTAQLQADLVAVTGVQIAVQAPADFVTEVSKSIEQLETRAQASQEIISEQTTVAEGSKPLILEEVGIIEDKSISTDKAVHSTEEMPHAELTQVFIDESIKTLEQEGAETMKILTTEQLSAESFEPSAVVQIGAIQEIVVPADVITTDIDDDMIAATTSEALPLSTAVSNEEQQVVVAEKIGITEDTQAVSFEDAAIGDKTQLIGVEHATVIEQGDFIQHIEEFISSQITEDVEELSNVTNIDGLKESVAIAKELRENIAAIATHGDLEETIPLKKEMRSEQAKLAQKLQGALSTLQIQVLDNAQEMSPAVNPETLQRVSEVITHLQDDLKVAVVSSIPEDIKTAPTEPCELSEENSMKQLESLLQDVSNKINITSTDRTSEDADELRDTLDEVQTVIIKLKRDCDGSVNDTLNETLEDLECSVRSVQLQINEDSPPDLLKEACATLLLLANNMNETQEVHVSETITKEVKEDNILEKCSNEAEETVNLLSIASGVDTKGNSQLNNIVSSLNNLKDTLKSLRLSFMGNAATLIDKGVEVMQGLDQMEEKVFCLERDVDAEQNLPSVIRDSIISAVHSVYGSISNMRSTISSIQKQYLYENYGKPSENFLRSIKNASAISKVDKVNWKKFSKSLRNVLNHFEDIKFYVNLDKTARLPSDAAFTKIILEELKCNMNEVLLPQMADLSPEVVEKIQPAIKCVEVILFDIETRTTLEVKEKIPMFKEIASKILCVTDSIVISLEQKNKISEELNAEEKLIEDNTIEASALDSDLQQKAVEVLTEITGEKSEVNDGKQAFIEEMTAVSLTTVEVKEEVKEIGGIIKELESTTDEIKTPDEIAIAFTSNDILDVGSKISENKKADSEPINEENVIKNIPLPYDDAVPSTSKDMTYQTEFPSNTEEPRKTDGKSLIETTEEDSLMKHEQVDLSSELGNNEEKVEFLQETHPSDTEMKQLSTEVRESEEPESKETYQLEVTQSLVEDDADTALKIVPLKQQEIIQKDTEGKENKQGEPLEEASLKEAERHILKEDEVVPDKVENVDESNRALNMENIELDTDNIQGVLKESNEEVTMQEERETMDRRVADDKSQADEKQKQEDMSDTDELKVRVENEQTDVKQIKEEIQKVDEELEKLDSGKLDKGQKNEAHAEKGEEGTVSELEKPDEMVEELKIQTSTAAALNEQNITLTKDKEEVSSIKDEMVTKNEPLDVLDTEKEALPTTEQEANKKVDEENCLKQVSELTENAAKEIELTENVDENSITEAVELEEARNEAELKMKEEEIELKKEKTRLQIEEEKQEKEDEIMKREETETLTKEVEPKKTVEEERLGKEETSLTKKHGESSKKENEVTEKIENETALDKEKQDPEMSQYETEPNKMDEQECLRKEKAVAEKSNLEAQLGNIEEEQRLLENNENLDAQKDEPETNLKKNEEEDQLNKERAEKIMTDAESKQKEDERRENEEKETLKKEKLSEEEESLTRQKRGLKEEEEVTENDRFENGGDLKKIEEDERLQEEKARIERELEKKEEDERLTKEHVEAEKLKTETELKKKTEEERLKKENEEAEIKRKEEDRLIREKNEADQLREVELKDEEDRLLKEQEKAQNAEKEALKAKQEAELREKQEEERLQKEKEQAEEVQREMELRKREEDERIKKAKDEAEKAEKEAELKKKEEEKRLKKEKKEAERAKKEVEAKKIEEEERQRIEMEKAEKIAEETNLKKKLEDERLEIEKQQAERAKREEEELQKKKDDERVKKEMEEAERAEKELKKREEEERVQKQSQEIEKAKIEAKKEDEKRLNKEKEEAEKAREEVETKRKEEEERLRLEREETEKITEEANLKKKREEERLEQEKEQAEKAKREAELQKREEEERITKDKEEAERAEKEAELKNREEEERVQKQNEEIEKTKKEAESKKKEEEKRLKKEKKEAEKAKKELETKKKEEEELLRKEKEEAERAAKEAELKKREEEERVQKQNEEIEKAKEEAESKKIEEEKRLKKEAEKAKKEVETKKKEEEESLRKEREEAERAEKEAELKKRQEEERVQKQNEEILKIKEETELKKKEEEKRLKKETKEAEKARKEVEAKRKEEEERLRLEREEAEKITEEANLNKKREEERLEIEKEQADKAKKETELMKREEDERIKKDREEAEKAEKEAELKKREEEERVQKQNDEMEKTKKEAELKKKEAELKKKEEEKRLKKEKKEAEKTKKEVEAKKREEEERQRMEREEAEKIAQEANLKKKLEEERLEIEKQQVENAKKEAVEIELKIKEKETQMAKKDAELKKTKEEKLLDKEREEAEVNKKETELRKKEEEDRKKKRQGEKKGDKDKITSKRKSKEEEDIRLNEENETSTKESKKKIMAETKLHYENDVKGRTALAEKSSDGLKVELTGVNSMRTKELEGSRSDENGEMSKSRRHETQEDFESKYGRTRRKQGEVKSVYDTEQRASIEASQSEDKHYIADNYEARRKQEDKEKPRFIDHNHKDYTMEFVRPSGYRERTFDDKAVFERDSLGRSPVIYKAQTIVLDSQLRSSLPPLPDITRSSEREAERRSEVRHRSKGVSEARSVLTEKRSSVPRDIKRKPVFSTYLTDRTAVEGSRVKLTCSVLSSSDPTITWYKNGVLLDNKLKYRTKFMDGLITLEVLNAVPSDSAEYSCTVENENGSVSSSANLKVYPSFEASPIPPTFTRSIRDNFHLAENELVLECRIRGQPLPTITWLKDDKPVSSLERYQAYYLADGVCRLAIDHPTPDDSGKYTCKAENSVWSDQITHVVNFTGKESRLSPNLATIERSRFNRQAMESRRPHFTNVLTDYKVTTGGTIGLQVEIRGSPTRVEWLREGRSVIDTYRNARAFVEQGLYTLALADVTEKESGMYTCRAWSTHGTVDMNAAITVVQPNELEGRPAIIVGRPEKDVLISVGEDLNISFRVQGEPKPKVMFMKGIRDITTSQRVCKMTSDDYVKFTVKRSVVSDAGTYCIFARNAYGCDRAFVTVVVRQRASSENLISDWTYPMDDSTLSVAERKYKSVPDRIPGDPRVVDGGNNWLSIAWPKPDPRATAPVLAYKVESWLLGKEGGARWTELGITPLNSFDAFNLKQGEEYHFRVTPRNRYGYGEAVQTSSPISIGLAGDTPEFVEILPGQLKVLLGDTANLSCSVKGKPIPEVVWMKNGHEIEEEDRRMTTTFNGYNCSLTINGIGEDDEARYSCEATNAHGRASTYARLAVVTDRLIWEADAKLKRERSAEVAGDYPPQFTMRLRDRRVQATYPVRLTCQVVGSPAPAVTWYRNGEEVNMDSRHSTYKDEHFHTLEVAPTTLEDGGVYEALARNTSGAISCRCCLVVDKGIRAYVAPEFCCGLEPLYRLNECEELRITAVVEAYPSVGVTWYRDGVRLRTSRRAVMTLDRDGQIELALASVTPRDAGVYTCTASNEVGRASTSGKVEVIEGEHKEKTRTPPVLMSPDVPYSKEPRFIRKPRSSEAREGDTVIIECEVIGDPKPDVYWLRDFLKPDYYRDATHFKRVGAGPEYRFEIPHAKLDYTGAYSVVARNAHGEAKAIISLQILAKDPNSSEEHNVRYGRVEVIPRFERNLTDLLCYDGDVIEFECRVNGNPEPDIRWFHYNELIRENPDFETILAEGGARLRIKQVTAEDEGTYICEASNCLGKTTSSACLVVYPPGEPNTLSQRLRRPPALLSAASTPRSTPRSTPARSVSRTPGPDTRRLCSPSRQMAPKFYTYPFNKVVEEGDHVVFQCAVKGLPAPWATWDKDGVIVTPSSRITIKEKDEILRILEIEQVTIEDVGLYRITLENDYGRVEASARLEVITQKGKFYAGVRAYSPSPRKAMAYRRRPSTSRQD